jgi:hypothetical protein
VKAVARLIPNTAAHDPNKTGAAAKRIRSRAKALESGAFDWREWKAYRDEGRPLPWYWMGRSHYPGSIATNRLLQHNRFWIASWLDGAWVPSLWRLEVANSLQSAVRWQRISKDFRDVALTDLSLLNIMIDPDTDTFA